MGKSRAEALLNTAVLYDIQCGAFSKSEENKYIIHYRAEVKFSNYV